MTLNIIENENENKNSKQINELNERFDVSGKRVINSIHKIQRDHTILYNQIVELALILEQIFIIKNQHEAIGYTYLYLIRYLFQNNIQYDLCRSIVFNALKDNKKYTTGLNENYESTIENKNSIDYGVILKSRKNRTINSKDKEENEELNNLDKSLNAKNVHNNINELKNTNLYKMDIEQLTEFKKDVENVYRSISGHIQSRNTIQSIETEQITEDNDDLEIDIDNDNNDDNYKPEEETKLTKRSISTGTKTAELTRITQKFMEIRDVFNELINQSMYNPVIDTAIESKIISYLDKFIEKIRYVIDNKHKLSMTDWQNISTVAKEGLVNSARSDIEFLTSYCAKCKDIDEELNKKGSKKIYKHVSMELKLNKDHNPDTDLYIWICPRCNGTERLPIKITRERLRANYRHMLTKMIDDLNKSNIEAGIELYFKTAIQHHRINHNLDVSNKLLSSK